MHNDVGAEGPYWRSVEVEGAMELGLGRQAWVDARGVEEIESYQCLREEAIP